ncbi:TPA: hypothetical protein ACHKET_000891 [Acinetobacter baumannii]|uniref:hypothetical protein n=1 Tax=Acinetobacter baumannii TaxID=470 RepID=UPI001EF449C3|nr:hypothetical protein [Acinetobacter baumannii]MCF4632825.1 hypothetical protein [Acinetobacter baumannii]
MKQIDDIVQNIKKFINISIESRTYYNSNLPKPSERHIIEWRNSTTKIVTLIDNIYTSSDILDDQKLSSIEIYLRQLQEELGRVHKHFINDPDGDFESNLSSLFDFLYRSKDIESFGSRYSIDSEKIRKLILLIESKHPNLNKENKIESFFNKNKDTSKSKYVLDRLFDLLNLHIKEFNEVGIQNKEERIIHDIDFFLELEERSIEINELANKSESILEEIRKEKKQFNENLSIESNSELLKGYSTETKGLGKTIIALNIIIFLLFLIIIGLFIFKFINLYNFFYETSGLNTQNFFENPWHLLSFFTLVLSISALLGYIIKFRNRLIKLHDHFNLIWLELSAMPKYMAELSPDERKYLYITLAPTYFKGFYPNKDAPSEIQKLDVDSITKFLDSISKISQDFKNPK